VQTERGQIKIGSGKGGGRAGSMAEVGAGAAGAKVRCAEPQTLQRAGVLTQSLKS
jgi:hypothetical protein